MDAFWALMLVFIARMIMFYQVIFEAYFRATRKAHISILFQSIISIFLIITGFLALYNNGKVVEYAFSNLIVVIILVPLYILLSKKLLNFREYQGAEFNVSQAKELFKKGLGYFLSPIWQAIYFQGTSLIVRITLGTTAVTLFNTVRTLLRSSSQAFAIVITATFPEFQYEIGKKNFNNAKKLFVFMLTANVVIATASVVVLSSIGLNLYSIWTNNQLVIDQTVWIIFILSIIFYALWCSY